MRLGLARRSGQFVRLRLALGPREWNDDATAGAGRQLRHPRIDDHLDIPVLAEGHINTPTQAAEALARGAYAVVVGTATTRPIAITTHFTEALRNQRS